MKIMFLFSYSFYDFKMGQHNTAMGRRRKKKMRKEEKKGV